MCQPLFPTIFSIWLSNVHIIFSTATNLLHRTIKFYHKVIWNELIFGFPFRDRHGCFDEMKMEFWFIRKSAINISLKWVGLKRVPGMKYLDKTYRYVSTRRPIVTVHRKGEIIYRDFPVKVALVNHHRKFLRLCIYESYWIHKMHITL